MTWILGRSRSSSQGLRRSHESGADAFALVVRGGRHVVRPPTVPVAADHGGADQASAIEHAQHSGTGAVDGASEVGVWVVPWTRQSTRLPERHGLFCMADLQFNESHAATLVAWAQGGAGSPPRDAGVGARGCPPSCPRPCPPSSVTWAVRSTLPGVVTAYMLTQTISTVLAGKFGDLWGRKRIFVLAIVIFVASSAMCGLSEGMTWLIVWRAIQGIGGGALTVTATALIADVIRCANAASIRAAWEPSSGWPRSSDP